MIAVVAEQLEELPIPGGIVDLDGTIAATNAAGARLLGRPAAQLVGRKVWEFAPGAEHIWQDVIASGRVADYHNRIVVATPDGPRTIHYVAGVRRYDDREYVLVFAVEIDRGEDEPMHRLESLGLVAGGIAHDFNNQLVSVLAEASSAREDATLSPAAQDALRRIEAAAQRMASLTRQLLAYTGRGRFVSELLDPDALLAELHDQLRTSVRPDAALQLVAPTSASSIHADPNLLREVIINLVVNASESLPPEGGKIRISTSQVTFGDTGCWRLDVKDDGVGMDARTVARIFDPYFTTKRDRHGLGLSAVQGIVRRLGGEISVDSKLGSGTTFAVRLPLARESPQRLRSKEPTAGSRLVQPGVLAGVTVLVADDEPSVRSTIRRLLERRGAAVVIASDGGEAAERLRKQRFDLVVLDVMMPGLTGYQLLPIARSTQPQAKVMLMSGYTDARSNGGEDEPDAFLEKPFTAKQIDDVVIALLGR